MPRARPLVPSVASEIPVVFRHRPARSAPFVDLRGDMVHWSHIERLAAVEGGFHEATLHVGPGTYAYKLHVGGDAWVRDPENPRTRSRDGQENSLLVVEGADEPVLHAPARPWLFVTDDGRTILRAGLRHGHGDTLHVRWSEGDGPRVAKLFEVAREDQHTLFEVALPASARTLDYVFVLASGRVVGRAGGAGQAFRKPLSSLAREAPSWWREAVIYSIFVDRFRRGKSGGSWPVAEADDRARRGGDLDGITEVIPYLADLGITALHLTPVVASHSAHRYDAVDPRRVDPALGGEAALGRLLEEAHQRGIRVLLDLAVTHVHRDFAPFADVRARGPKSPYATWFHIKYWPFPEGPDGGYLHYEKGQWQEPLLRTEEPEVVDYLAETFAHWARFGADGFRVDAAADVPIGLLRRVAEAARVEREDIVLYGEVIPGNLPRFTADALESATDFPAQEAWLDLVARRKAGAARTAERLAWRRFDRGGAPWSAVGFTATHDQARLITQTNDPRAARLGHLASLLGSAVPAIYYGDEIGLRGAGGGARDFDDAWPDRAPMEWDPACRDGETHRLFRDAIALRRARKAISGGDETLFAAPGIAEDDVLVLRRTHGDEVVDVVLHAGDGTRQLTLPEGAPSGATMLLALGEAAMEGGQLTLGPWSAAVIDRVPFGDTMATFRALAAESRLVSGLAFREGHLECPSPPSSLYLTVTERCNIRCLHCITDAPARTADGRARTMAPWVVGALREAFAAADYVAFVHGGEAITAPIFPDVLRAIQRAREGRTTHVHLLSNGMLLDARRTRELVSLGVTSLSVSIDGVTAGTNDKLRLGGKLDTILQNLRTVVRTRAEMKADLRVGVSTVVTAGNVHELPLLGEAVVALGLDWLKVEDLYPCTPTARREMLFPRAPEVGDAMGRLRRALAGSSVVLVDHLDPPRGCACAAKQDPTLAAFRAADDFANRVTMHPCRAAWEQACVDPDGTVHAVDYASPPLGNLSEASFLELWNGPAAEEARAAALRMTSPAMRRGCPLSRADQ